MSLELMNTQGMEPKEIQKTVNIGKKSHEFHGHTS